MLDSDSSIKSKLDILILCQSQFGFHIDTYFYCKYLRVNHNVTYICWNYGWPMQHTENIKVHYVSRRGNLFSRNSQYLLEICKYLRERKVDICFIKYFRGCSIVRFLFPKIIFIFDIRTGSVNKKWYSRIAYDSLMRFESCFFNNITVISNSLRKRLLLDKKAKILPLGSIPLSDNIKTFNELNLLYVGTLTNRNIDKAIHGFALFIKSYSSNIKCCFTIVGDGYNNEVEDFRYLVEKLGLVANVNVVGRIPFEELGQYFENHNIGVSFVPITPFFDVQPVTKTFDYLLSGMAVIATNTIENRMVINNSNGILIPDTSEGFCFGLRKILDSRRGFSSRNIREDSTQYHWQTIVSELELSISKLYQYTNKSH